MCQCKTTELLDHRHSDDSGFMGRTHVFTGFLGFAIMLFLSACFAPHIWTFLLGSGSIWVLVLFAETYFGATLPADLDNTASTSRSSMGILGDALSVVFRLVSRVIQTTIRLKRDDPNPNPHRGFFHTHVASLLLGGLVYLMTSNTTVAFSTEQFGKVTWGWLGAFILSALLLNMMLAATAKKSLYRLKKKAGIFADLAPIAVSALLTFVLFMQLPPGLDFRWLALAVIAGNTTHIVGDTFTTAGTPFFFPLPIKGKLWWTVRFFPLKVGEEAEKVIAVLILVLTAVMAVLTVLVKQGVGLN